MSLAASAALASPLVAAAPAQAADRCASEKQTAREAEVARTDAHQALYDYEDTAFDDYEAAVAAAAITRAASLEANQARRGARDAYGDDRTAENKQALADAVVARDLARADHEVNANAVRAEMQKFRSIRLERQG